VVSQNFPTVTQNIVEPHCTTTTQRHKSFTLRLSWYSDVIVAVAQNKSTVTKEGQTFKKTDYRYKRRKCFCGSKKVPM